MALSEIVSVTIQSGTARVSRQGFGVPLLLFFHSVWAGTEEREYVNYSGLIEDFDSDHPVALAALKLFSQNPRPRSIMVGRLPTPATGQIHRIDCTGRTSADGVINGTITDHTGAVATIATAWNTSLTQTMTDLALEITTDTGGWAHQLTAAGDATGVTITGDDPGYVVSIDFSDENFCEVRETTADWGYDDELALILDRSPDFFWVLTDSNSPKNMDKVAVWCAANERFAAFGPQYTKPSQFVSGEFTAGADYTALQANDSAFGLFTRAGRFEYVEAALVGRMAPLDPGSATWAYKSLEITGADDYTASERSTIEGYNGNHYRTEAGLDITFPGTMFGGEYIDIALGLAWLKANLQADVFALLASSPKVPYTDRGGSMIRSVVASRLKIAERRGIIDAGWAVTVLPVADQDEADRAARIFRDVEFTARLAGAIHEVLIVGTVSA
jgi:hypothetical protein